VIGPHGGDRIVGVGDRDDLRQERNRLFLQAIGVARSVDGFVVMQDDRGDLRDSFAADRREDVVAATRMGSHDAHLFLVEATRLEQHAVGDADLADVVQFRRELQGRQVVGRQAARLSGLEREAAGASGVRGGVLVALAKRAVDRGGCSGKVFHGASRECRTAPLSGASPVGQGGASARALHVPPPTAGDTCSTVARRDAHSPPRSRRCCKTVLAERVT